MKTWGKKEITPQMRERMEVAGKLALKWLANGASTDDAMKPQMECNDEIYELTIYALERDGYIERGTWGKLSVWRRR